MVDVPMLRGQTITLIRTAKRWVKAGVSDKLGLCMYQVIRYRDSLVRPDIRLVRNWTLFECKLVYLAHQEGDCATITLWSALSYLNCWRLSTLHSTVLLGHHHLFHFGRIHCERDCLRLQLRRRVSCKATQCCRLRYKTRSTGRPPLSSIKHCRLGIHSARHL